MLVTASKPDIKLPVDIHGELSLVGPSGLPVKLQGVGSRLRVAAPDWAELSQIGPRSLLTRRRVLKGLIRSLETLGLSLEVVVAGKRAFEFGAGVKATLLARFFGLASADIRFSNVFKLLR